MVPTSVASTERRPSSSTDVATTAPTTSTRCRRPYAPPAREPCSCRPDSDQGHDPDVPGRERAHRGAMSSHTRHPPYTRNRSVMSSTMTAAQIRLNRVTPSHCRVVLDNPPLNLMGPEFVLQIRDIVRELENDDRVK